ncbi:MAG: diadenylate cyclase CdaA [Paludibacteraceae bacterium]|nr:diadenylate cyclase CdaA [Paludibacteraceae bacterium]
MPQLKDIIDILLFAFILYGVFRLLRRSGVVNLFWGILAFFFVLFIVRYVFRLEMTGALFDRVSDVGVIALIVIFQNEIRSFFYNIGIHIGRLSHRLGSIRQDARTATIDKIVSAARNMSHSRTGALIILECRHDLSEYADTGERLDARISQRLIEHIFFKNTPLHDGALIVRNDLLVSAACILPLAPDRDLPKQYGLRHRAALGISEQTDAIALVVSEETGEIAIAHNGNIQPTPEQRLSAELTNLWIEQKN